MIFFISLIYRDDMGKFRKSNISRKMQRTSIISSGSRDSQSLPPKSDNSQPPKSQICKRHVHNLNFQSIESLHQFHHMFFVDPHPYSDAKAQPDSRQFQCNTTYLSQLPSSIERNTTTLTPSTILLSPLHTHPIKPNPQHPHPHALAQH